MFCQRPPPGLGRTEGAWVDCRSIREALAVWPGMGERLASNSGSPITGSQPVHTLLGTCMQGDHHCRPSTRLCGPQRGAQTWGQPVLRRGNARQIDRVPSGRRAGRPCQPPTPTSSPATTATKEENQLSRGACRRASRALGGFPLSANSPCWLSRQPSLKTHVPVDAGRESVS